MDALSLDRMMRTWAEAQHSLVGTDQLRAARVAARAVHRRAASSDWELVTPRVLRLVGAVRTGEQRVMAAVLDVGRGTVASHITAAALWGLPGFPLRQLEISRPRNGSDRATSLARLHHPRLLPPHHCTVHQGIPLTTLARTVVDLGGILHPARVEVVVHAAVRLGVPWAALGAMVAELSSTGRPGVGVVRRLVEDNAGTRPMESGLEVTFLRLLTGAGLPSPRRQVDLGGCRVGRQGRLRLRRRPARARGERRLPRRSAAASPGRPEDGGPRGRRLSGAPAARGSHPALASRRRPPGRAGSAIDRLTGQPITAASVAIR
ncbi:MAG: hypothetical protein ACR2MO_04560 [Acidimicrobiales bacterium]